MKRLDAHISSLDPALQEAPEVFDGVGMNVSMHIFNGMINDSVGILVLEPMVRLQSISEQFGSPVQHVAIP